MPYRSPLSTLPWPSPPPTFHPHFPHLRRRFHFHILRLAFTRSASRFKLCVNRVSSAWFAFCNQPPTFSPFTTIVRIYMGDSWWMEATPPTPHKWSATRPPHHHKIRSHSLNHRSTPFQNTHTHHPFADVPPPLTLVCFPSTRFGNALCDTPTQPPPPLSPYPQTTSPWTEPLCTSQTQLISSFPFCTPAKLFCHAKHEKIYILWFPPSAYQLYTHISPALLLLIALCRICHLFEQTHTQTQTDRLSDTEKPQAAAYI